MASKYFSCVVDGIKKNNSKKIVAVIGKTDNIDSLSLFQNTFAIKIPTFKPYVTFLLFLCQLILDKKLK